MATQITLRGNLYGEVLYQGRPESLQWELYHGYDYKVEIRPLSLLDEWIESTSQPRDARLVVNQGLGVIPMANKLDRIKFLRNVSSLTNRPLGLKDAKDIIESLV